MSWRVSLLALSFLFLPAIVLATDLRGRVVRDDPYRGSIPAPGVRLTLQSKTGQTTPVLSGSDGFYYIYNVAPNSYTLIYIYTSRRLERKQGALSLTVRSTKSQDVPQIVLKD